MRLTGLVAIAYQHETSRCGDPHLHAHVIVPNRQASADGVLVSIDGTSLYHEARAAVVIYQAALRREHCKPAPARLHGFVAGYRLFTANDAESTRISRFVTEVLKLPILLRCKKIGASTGAVRQSLLVIRWSRVPRADIRGRRRGTADFGSRRNTSRRERNRSSVLSVAGSGRRRALVRAGMPTRQGRCASLRDRPAAGP